MIVSKFYHPNKKQKSLYVPWEGGGTNLVDQWNSRPSHIEHFDIHHLNICMHILVTKLIRTKHE